MTGTCHHYCLQTREVVSSHTALNLGDEISRSTEEWEITSKVVMVTTDNGQNIKNAVTEVLELFNFGCIGHTLQLSIGKVPNIFTGSSFVTQIARSDPQSYRQ